MAQFESLESVQKSIELQKDLLQTTEDSIKKITGRSPDHDKRNESDLQIGVKRRFNGIGGPPSVFSRLKPAADNQREPKFSSIAKPPTDLDVSVPSSVVRVGEKRSREDAIKENRLLDKDRNRRMLGVLQATLSASRAEAEAAAEAAGRRRREALESRIDARTAAERDAARAQRSALFRARRRNLLEIDLLTARQRLIRQFEEWKAEELKKVGFIRTEQTPPIFYRPNTDNKTSEARKAATKAAIMNNIEARRAFLDAEFNEMATYRRQRLGPSTEETEKAESDAKPAVGGDKTAPEGGDADAAEAKSSRRVVHLNSSSSTTPAAAATAAPLKPDLEDLVDEPELMDAEEVEQAQQEDRRIVSAQ